LLLEVGGGRRVTGPNEATPPPGKKRRGGPAGPPALLFIRLVANAVAVVGPRGQISPGALRGSLLTPARQVGFDLQHSGCPAAQSAKGDWQCANRSDGSSARRALR